MNRVDVLILAALQDELDAVLREHEGFRETRSANGIVVHHATIENAKGRPLKIAAAWLGGMGETKAAMVGAALANELDPSCLAMCGICAGKRGVVGLGDVILAERVYSYDHGKLVASEDESSFKHDLETYNLDKAWQHDASRLVKDLSWAKHILATRPISRASQERWALHAIAAYEAEGGPSPQKNPERKMRCPDWTEVIDALLKSALVTREGSTLRLSSAGRDRVDEEQILYPDAESLPADPPLRAHIGAIATGKVVREDPQIFERLSRLVRKTIGLEMEAAAIGQVASQLNRRFVVVKGVSDYADHEKDDAYRAFAARASAAFLLSLVRACVETEATPAPASPNTALPSTPLRDVGALVDELENAYARRDELANAGVDASAVLQEILALKRKLREGGHLHAGDSLSDGRYLLLEQVGRGGYGYVWRARDRKTSSDVAIKVLHSVVAADPSRRERFFRGARVMASLEHEAVVRVLEQRGEDAGFHYFVMEFLPSGDLRQAVLRGEVRPNKSMDLILAIAQALGAAHRTHIVHRDIKPANILLTADGKAKLTDFDLVAAHDTTGGTKSGALGTFVYAAPECLHHPQNATARADVFGLGMTAIFVLYGRELPLDVVRDAARFIEERLACDARVEAVLKQAVAWEAAARFEDAGVFATALQKALAPLADEPAPFTDRFPGQPIFHEAKPNKRKDDVCAVAIGPEAQFVAIGHRDGTTRLWHAQTKQCIHALWTRGIPIRALAFAMGAPLLATLSEDGMIAIWHTTTGELLNRFGFRTTTPSCIAFSAEQSSLLVGTNNGTVQSIAIDAPSAAESVIGVWIAKTPEPILHVGTAALDTRLIAYCASGELAVLGPLGQRTLHELPAKVTCIAQALNAEHLVLATKDGNLVVVTLNNAEILPRVIGIAPNVPITGVAFCYGTAQQRLLCVTFDDSDQKSEIVIDSFRVSEINTPLVLRGRNRITCLAGSPNGLLLAIGTEGGSTLLVDPRTRETVGLLHPSQ